MHRRVSRCKCACRRKPSSHKGGIVRLGRPSSSKAQSQAAESLAARFLLPAPGLRTTLHSSQRFAARASVLLSAALWSVCRPAAANATAASLSAAGGGRNAGAAVVPGASCSGAKVRGILRPLHPPGQRRSVLPNTSLKLTRYGMRCKPALRCSAHLLSPGLQRMPPQAA